MPAAECLVTAPGLLTYLASEICDNCTIQENEQFETLNCVFSNQLRAVCSLVCIHTEYHDVSIHVAHFLSTKLARAEEIRQKICNLFQCGTMV